jgi:hypothetical protein
MIRRLLVAASIFAAVPALVPAGTPPLPQELTSFGATVLDETLYIYGGHTGAAHEYSTAGQSGQMLRIDLAAEQSSWQELTGGPKLQGLALVAHGDRVYRFGGFTAVNEEGQDHDLRSQAGVAVYDPAENKWEELTPLPEPRSSFDAALLDDRVYVIGGWNLQGESSGDWHTTAWSADLTKRPLVWEPVPTPPFQRRALAVAASGKKIYAIGGMSEDGTTRRVDVLDTETGAWTEGPELIGERSIHGFGPAARATDDGLFVSSLAGIVQRLDDDGKSWSEAAPLAAPRFFHAMVPVRDGLLLVGGANMTDGKIAECDRISVRQPAASVGK